MRNKILISLIVGLFLINIVCAYDSHKQYTNLYYSFTSNNATQCNITIANTPYGNITINQIANREGQTFTSFIDGGNFSQTGNYCFNIVCTDGSQIETGSFCREITPTGKKIADEGQVSIGILYFLVILGFGLIFLGYLFLNKESPWTNYFGIFLMCIGFIFIYYDLHLSNLYANTIAINAGAENTTTSTFIMVNRFLKITPYLAVLIVIGVIIKLYKNSIKKKAQDDGWDNNQF